MARETWQRLRLMQSFIDLIRLTQIHPAAIPKGPVCRCYKSPTDSAEIFRKYKLQLNPQKGQHSFFSDILLRKRNILTFKWTIFLST